MRNAAIVWRTDMRDCLIDLLSFIEEQVELAKKDVADQYAAIDAARGVIPLLKCRLKEKEEILTSFMLTDFAQQFEAADWRDWWEDFARAGTPAFSKKADGLLETITVLKSILAEESEDYGRRKTDHA
jgi:hypothetical protein